MIQRKQTLFLLQLIFFGVALLFIPASTALLVPEAGDGEISTTLTPLSSEAASSTGAHYAAIALNFLGLVLAFVTIFLYTRRELQLKLCYVLLVLWLALTALMTFFPFIKQVGPVASVSVNYFVAVIGVFGILASYFAARFVKRDIELLKSADRIR